MKQHLVNVELQNIIASQINYFTEYYNKSLIRINLCLRYVTIYHTLGKKN